MTLKSAFKKLAVARQHRLTEPGQAMVEFAFMFPFLVLILLGTVDLGHGIYAYGVVSSAAREGARYASTNHEFDDYKPGGNIETVARTNTAALDPTRITVTAQQPPYCDPPPAPCGGGFGKIQVTVTYQFQPLTLFFAPLTMTGKSTMYLE